MANDKKQMNINAIADAGQQMIYMTGMYTRDSFLTNWCGGYDAVMEILRKHRESLLNQQARM
jgi:hypothetical protein